MLSAVVLAGTGKAEPLTEQEKVSNKAFITINEKPLIAYILEALEGSSLIENVAVVGPEKGLEEIRRGGHHFELVPEQGTMLDNMAAGFNVVDKDRLCLVVTGDIPLITSEVIDQFIEQCQPQDYDLYYPVLTRDTCLKRFPDTERTYVRLKEGYLTGGNIALINPAWFIGSRSRLEMFISYRKKPLKLLRIFPPLFILKYFMKTLSVTDLEKFLSHLLHFKAKAVYSQSAEIGIDVDKISDLELVRSTL
ncbi:MAG: nucleotidyltransferase family protein [Bacillota bacterium]|nr:nucleotidyltransferase family protein [Bacillota bacterium]